MQPPFSCMPATLSSIEAAISPARLGRYMAAAQGDRNLALRLCVWNISLCEALYMPVQFAEVALRNAICRALETRYGAGWPHNAAFLCTLPMRLSGELNRAGETERQLHRDRTTPDHIVSALSFGFWLHMLTTNYQGSLWPIYFSISFPNKPQNIALRDLHRRADRLRILRNRIAHHKPIFDRGPVSDYDNIITLIEWILDETAWFVRQTARLSQTINQRPQS